MGGMRNKYMRIALCVAGLLVALFGSYLLGDRNGFHRGYTQAEDDNGIQPMRGVYPVRDLVISPSK
jgi:hypothetical protein